ncbi:hypothetical protein BH23GEM3_BH23GEM3_05640 [soil metagenome]|nr:hypothetical protein [Gemmatimonadota bacterium]
MKLHFEPDLDYQQAFIEAVWGLFRDSAFADDVAKTNLAAILNQHGLQNVRSL